MLQWDLLEPVFHAPGKRGRRHADDLRRVVDALLQIAQTRSQERYPRKRRQGEGQPDGRHSGPAT